MVKFMPPKRRGSTASASAAAALPADGEPRARVARPPPRPWTPADDELLKMAYRIVFEMGLNDVPPELQKHFPPLSPEQQAANRQHMENAAKTVQRNKSWSRVSELVGGRTANSCFSRYRLLNNKGGAPPSPVYTTDPSKGSPESEQLTLSSASSDEAIPRKLPSIKAPAKTRSEPRTQRAWTRAEDMRLSQLVATYGKRWAEIIKHLPGRSTAECQARYASQQSIRSAARSEISQIRPWTESEVKWLFVLVETDVYRHGTISWHRIAKELSDSGRTWLQCQAEYQRWQRQRTTFNSHPYRTAAATNQQQQQQPQQQPQFSPSPQLSQASPLMYQPSPPQNYYTHTSPQMYSSRMYNYPHRSMFPLRTLHPAVVPNYS
ncbi:hypothetical protein GQ42DRAFT_153073 [Ramicandelaber brevisporus]|nr:hypothetical protein GQ42DRAFT_153073 [Ramicandelaber brevisporus]